MRETIEAKTNEIGTFRDALVKTMEPLVASMKRNIASREAMTELTPRALQHARARLGRHPMRTSRNEIPGVTEED
ncbi:MAG: hypothetical protein D6723_12970 [Acidobacteria bacterium]|nr:MAG: hypothetical protein D6723_12970 [Acidobacteriota bacterium]